MILTVARPSEARLVDWKEIDLDEKLWAVPAGTHKSSEEWKIPLCPQAMKILKAQPTRKGRVFSTLNNKEIPDAYLSSTPDALGFDAVAYGFRSTSRTWGQEQVKSSEEALELSLKHLEASATRPAYARSQLFYERRRILNAYELWCFKGDAGQSNKVIDLPKRRKLANA
jgi:integrase